MGTSSSYASLFNVRNIEEVIGDLRLKEAGYSLHYAVDPHEIFAFCFPIRPERHEQRDINHVANDQIALSEIFYGEESSPLLMDAYFGEIEGLMQGLNSRLARAYSDTEEMINTFINEGDINAELFESDYIDVLANKLNILLAVVSGIYSLGVNRFQDIYNRIQTKGGFVSNKRTFFGSDNPSVFSRFLSDYTESQLSNLIFNEIIAISAAYKDDSAFRRNAKVDAIAIDQIVHLNKVLIKTEVQESIGKHVILYLSSARRTDFIFDSKKIDGYLPKLDNKIFSFHRTRSQILLGLVHKSDDTAQTIKKMEGLMEMVREFPTLRTQEPDFCSTCILDGKEPYICTSKTICERIKQIDNIVESKRQEVRNLGLATSLDRFKGFIEEKKETFDSKVKGQLQQRCLDILRKVDALQIKKIAQEKILSRQKLLLIQRLTADLWSRSHKGLIGVSGDFSYKEFLRDNRDSITGTAHYLPTKPKINNPIYFEIVQTIVEYYKTPPQGGQEKFAQLDRAFLSFFSIDQGIEDLILEHELVRSLLYLAFPSEQGDEIAYDHATRMLSMYSLIEQFPEVECEFHYVACWSARRLRRYKDAKHHAEKGLERYPNDPRFYHGRLITRIAKLSDDLLGKRIRFDKKNINPQIRQGLLDLSIKETINEVVSDGNRAIELYRALSNENEDVVSAILNSIAYMYALSSTQDSQSEADKELLTKARQYLDLLKQNLPPDHWSPNYPEYFHTQSFIEYYEALLLDRSQQFAQAKTKLDHSRRSIVEAIQLNTKQTYLDLRELIDKSIHRLGP
jgi:hypothetical protein